MCLKRAVLVVLAVLAATLPGALCSAAEKQPTISQVSVRLNMRDPLPLPIRLRIQETVQKVSIKALGGKTIPEAENLKDSLTQVLKKIFNETISGFSVNNLSISLGTTVTIELDLEATQPCIDTVTFEVVPQSGISSEWAPFFEDKLIPAGKQLASVLKGIPVESSRWSEQIIEQIISDELKAEDLFPGFELTPVVAVDPKTIVRLTMKPVGETIRHVQVKTRSTTLPSMSLERLKLDIASRAELLRGLPVSFAKKYQDEIVLTFSDIMSESRFARRMGMDFTVKLDIAPTSMAMVQIESKKYSAFLRAKIGIGKEQRNPDLEGHFGLFTGRKGTEIFSEANFFPGPLESQFDLGIGQKIGKHLYLAAGREFVNDLNRIWVNYYLSEDIVLSYERNVVNIDSQKEEGSITFRAHDYFSIELVSDFRTDAWISVNGNL